MTKVLVLAGLLAICAAASVQTASAVQGGLSISRAEKRVACINATKYKVSDRGHGWRSRFRACMVGRWA
jgi:hypothetical protein